MIKKITKSDAPKTVVIPGKEETPEEKYARTHPEQHRGISGCCDNAEPGKQIDKKDKHA